MLIERLLMVLATLIFCMALPFFTWFITIAIQMACKIMKSLTHKEITMQRKTPKSRKKYKSEISNVPKIETLDLTSSKPVKVEKSTANLRKPSEDLDWYKLEKNLAANYVEDIIGQYSGMADRVLLDMPPFDLYYLWKDDNRRYQVIKSMIRDERIKSMVESRTVDIISRYRDRRGESYLTRGGSTV